MNEKPWAAQIDLVFLDEAFFWWKQCNFFVYLHCWIPISYVDKVPKHANYYFRLENLINQKNQAFLLIAFIIMAGRKKKTVEPAPVATNGHPEPEPEPENVAKLTLAQKKRLKKKQREAAKKVEK